MISIAWGIAIIANPVLHAAQGAELKPEKNKLEVAIAATGPLYLPIILANEAGYFSKRGVTHQEPAVQKGGIGLHVRLIELLEVVRIPDLMPDLELQSP